MATGVLRARVGGAWVDIPTAGPQGPQGPVGVQGPPGLSKLVAVGTMQPNPAIGANVLGGLTNPITCITLTNHYYRIVVACRAVSPGGAGSIRLNLSINTNVNIGDSYLWVQGAFTKIYQEWLFKGDGISHNFIAQLQNNGTGTCQVYTDTAIDCFFYIEDLGVPTG